MTAPPATSQSTNLPAAAAYQSTNPYVGPRTFETADRQRYFGREAEAASLLGRVISERLLLFYAQSGAGKSSLINARLIPALRDEEGYNVLPVARVAGTLPEGVAQVDNIFLFNLMASLDRAATDPGQFARLDLTDFLEHLVTEDGEAWRYDPAAAAGAEEAPPAADDEPAAASAGRFALIVDQFEEIITGHPERWGEREAFFRQLDAALQANPNLWIVLSLREDYVAALDPYAPLVFNRLRARFYMERMGVAAALDAVRRPAELAGRPFAAGAAEQLVDNLRQVRGAGHDETVLGQFVEPVQLQLVCFQMWERLRSTVAQGQQTADSDRSSESLLITEADVAVAGDVNQALEQFYCETLTSVLGEPAVRATGVTERVFREWFDRELITETGLRNKMFRNGATGKTGTMSNAAVDALNRRFLVRIELSGGAWVELVHDRLVKPIRVNNAAWFLEHLSTLQRQASEWDRQGRPTELLLRDEALAEAEKWVAMHGDDLVAHDEAFLEACRKAVDESRRQHEAVVNKRLRTITKWAMAETVFFIVAVVLTPFLATDFLELLFLLVLLLAMISAIAVVINGLRYAWLPRTMTRLAEPLTRREQVGKSVAPSRRSRSLWVALAAIILFCMLISCVTIVFGLSG